MVSIGTVLSLIAGGAVIAGGIAVFSNLGGIRDAFARGVEESVTKPFSDYLDSLFQGNGASTQSSIAGETVPFTEPTPMTPASQVFIPGDTTVEPSGVVTSKTPPLLILSPEEKESATFIQQANVSQSDLALGREGFYYFNVVGSEFDTQSFLSSKEAIQLSKAPLDVLFNPAGLTDIRFLSKSLLGDTGFQLFGESKGYL